MFYIEDGRKNFYQWDLDRKIICADENITQVHFYYTKDKVLPVKVEDDEQGRYFKVPNILLQKAGQMRLYGYSVNHTKIEQQFSILPRPKPEDYIYTEEEYYTIEKIVTEKLLEAKESGEFDGEDGKDGEDGANGITPQLRINATSNEWEVSYDDGASWTSLGVKATGTNGINGKDGTDGEDGKDGVDGADGKDGSTPYIQDGYWYINGESTGVKAEGIDGQDGTNGVDGVDGKDGLTPYIGENGNWWIGDTDTGVKSYMVLAQELGDSPDKAISQKAVTDAIDETAKAAYEEIEKKADGEYVNQIASQAAAAIGDINTELLKKAELTDVTELPTDPEAINPSALSTFYRVRKAVAYVPLEDGRLDPNPAFINIVQGLPETGKFIFNYAENRMEFYFNLLDGLLYAWSDKWEEVDVKIIRNEQEIVDTSSWYLLIPEDSSCDTYIADPDTILTDTPRAAKIITDYEFDKAVGEFDKAIGDIDTALDSIIEIQNSLMGG